MPTHKISALGLIGSLALTLINVSCCGMKGCGSSAELNRPTPCPASFIEKKHKIQGHDWTVFKTQTEGPPVLLLHEITGLSHDTLCLAQALSEGPGKYRVYVPQLFGTWDNKQAEWLTVFARASKGSRWDVFSKTTAGTIVREAGELCGRIQKENQGQKVMVIGNCLTASWPVALLENPAVSGGIVCQPVLPMLPVTRRAKNSVAVTDRQFAEARRLKKKLIGFCYLQDRFTREPTLARLHRLQNELGENFTPYILAAAKDQVPAWAKKVTASQSKQHSTLTRSAGLQESIERDALLQITHQFITEQASSPRGTRG